MADVGDRSFDNPAYEPQPWDDDDYGDETTPSFQPTSFHPMHPHWFLANKLKCRQCSTKKMGCQIRLTMRRVSVHQHFEGASLDCCKRFISKHEFKQA